MGYIRFVVIFRADVKLHHYERIKKTFIRMRAKDNLAWGILLLKPVIVRIQICSGKGMGHHGKA